MLNDTFLLDITRMCKSFTAAGYRVCDKITPDALHEVYKVSQIFIFFSKLCYGFKYIMQYIKLFDRAVKDDDRKIGEDAQDENQHYG